MRFCLILSFFSVEAGDNIHLIGYPKGDFSYTKGSINSETYEGLNLFKLDPTANAGNSGSPVILEDQQTVIGMLVGDKETTEGGKVAIKSNVMKEALE